MSIAYRSTCRWTIGQPLFSTYWSTVSRHIDRCSTDMLSDISNDTSQLTYRPTLDRYVGQHINRHSANMSTDMSVEGCTKYTWSVFINQLSQRVILRRHSPLSHGGHIGYDVCTLGMKSRRCVSNLRFPAINHAQGRGRTLCDAWHFLCI